MTDCNQRSLVRRPVVVTAILLVAAAVPDWGAAQIASNAAPPEARAALLDASRPEQERLRSLMQLSNAGVPALDSETLPAAVDLATRARSASIRESTWRLLVRLVPDPTLLEPLSEALLSDPDSTVRREVAFALAAYREEELSQRSLANAMRNDSSAEVRLAAQMSMMERAQQEAFASESLHDRGLMPAVRLWPTALLRFSSETRRPSDTRPISDAEMADALAIAEIVSLTDDPTLKVLGLQELQLKFSSARLRSGPRPGPEITRVMIDSSKFEDFEVRRAALGAMLGLSDDPEIRAALQTVVENEPELAARLRIPEALAR